MVNISDMENLGQTTGKHQDKIQPNINEKNMNKSVGPEELEIELNSNILKITRMMKIQYPGLSKYLEKMQRILPV